MPIGPELPPHLVAKRKRAEDEDNDVVESPPSKKVPTPTAERKTQRPVLGPSLPPAPLEEMPVNLPPQEQDDSDTDSEEDIGPSLPPTGSSASPAQYVDKEIRAYQRETAKTEPKLQRDAWMMVPPKQDDLAARMDPTKIRARKFNTGKGARGPNQSSAGANGAWTETPEQKRQRLENEVLGLTPTETAVDTSAKDAMKGAEDEEKARRIREHNERHRNQSLYEQHKGSAKKEEADDPSKRAFDYEKDMGSGAKIGHVQKREMLNRAANFSSRFTSGRYL